MAVLAPRNANFFRRAATIARRTAPSPLPVEARTTARRRVSYDASAAASSAVSGVPNLQQAFEWNLFTSAVATIGRSGDFMESSAATALSVARDRMLRSRARPWESSSSHCRRAHE